MTECKDPVKLEYEALVAIIEAINDKACSSEVVELIDEKFNSIRCINKEEVGELLRKCGEEKED